MGNVAFCDPVPPCNFQVRGRYLHAYIYSQVNRLACNTSQRTAPRGTTCVTRVGARDRGRGGAIPCHGESPSRVHPLARAGGEHQRGPPGARGLGAPAHLRGRRRSAGLVEEEKEEESKKVPSGGFGAEEVLTINT